MQFLEVHAPLKILTNRSHLFFRSKFFVQIKTLFGPKNYILTLFFSLITKRWIKQAEAEVVPSSSVFEVEVEVGVEVGVEVKVESKLRSK